MKEIDTRYFEQLLNWIEDRLPAAEAKKLEAQLETADHDTLALIKWLREFQRLAQKYRLANPPGALDETLHNIFNRHPEEEERHHFFQRLQATLTFDSYRQAAMAGVRSATAQKSERQVVYSADLAEITLDLHWIAKEMSVNLNGQVFPIDETDKTIYTVEVQKETGATKISQTDKLGRFTFSALAPGVYDITLRCEQAEIVMTAVDLRF